jgi:hypothetical protein
MEKEDLKKSYEKFGALYPILTDKDGNVIDGFHRKEIDANWPTMKIDTNDESRKQIIALVANITRREITDVEKTKRLDAIAELTKWKPNQIAEEIGMGADWVRKHISDKYKDVSMADRGQGRPLSEIKQISTTDADSSLGLTEHETTMTEKEEKEMEDFKGMVIVFPPEIRRALEKEADKLNIDAKHLVMRIIRKWVGRKG